MAQILLAVMCTKRTVLQHLVDLADGDAGGREGTCEWWPSLPLPYSSDQEMTNKILTELMVRLNLLSPGNHSVQD
ncbi:hypothetical protein D3C81_829140 [compost metagenome]